MSGSGAEWASKRRVPWTTTQSVGKRTRSKAYNVFEIAVMCGPFCGGIR
jgi:hypothetical protein